MTTLAFPQKARVDYSLYEYLRQEKAKHGIASLSETDAALRKALGRHPKYVKDVLQFRRKISDGVVKDLAFKMESFLLNETIWLVNSVRVQGSQFSMFKSRRLSEKLKISHRQVNHLLSGYCGAKLSYRQTMLQMLRETVGVA